MTAQEQKLSKEEKDKRILTFCVECGCFTWCYNYDNKTPICNECLPNEILDYDSDKNGITFIKN